MGYLIFSIGPVQGFISQARKAQDLYAGSFLVSYLSSVAWEALKEQGLKPIYPKTLSISVPNIMLFEAERDRAEEAALKASQRVKGQWERLVFKALGEINQDIEAQIRDFPEVYWAWGENIKETQIYHGASKRLREFHQITADHRSLKCSICGEREALFFRKRNGELPYLVRNFGEHIKVISLRDKSFKLREISPGEGLCALCFSKRTLGRANLPGFNPDFPSTAKVALMKVEEAHREKFRRFREFFRKVEFNDQFYYEENLNEEYFRKEGIEELRPEEAKAVHQGLFEGIFLPRYYAILIADGDNMGEKIAYLSEEELSSFSEALLGFGAKARGIVKKPHGQVIYAGGDDLMAFMNLGSILDTLEKLRGEFPEDLTLSASLVIAHYKTPLSQVFREAREGLKNGAKKISGKDALAIITLRHSGTRTVSYLKWDALREVKEILNMLEGELTTNFIYSLLSLTLEAPLPEAPFLSLARTFISRSISQEKKAKEISSKAMELFQGLFAKCIKLEFEGISSQFEPLRNFLHLLENIAFLRRQIKEGK